MKELEQAGAGLEAGILKEDLKDLVADLSNMPLQELGENIPGLSYFFKGMKAVGAFRDYQLMNKVLEFLNELSKMPTEKRKSLVDKINSDQVFGQRFGTYLISAIDRHEFAQKSVYLARACKYFERGDIFKTDLVKLNTMIDNLHLQDMLEWMHAEYITIPKSEKEPAYNSFLANGVIMREYDFNEIGKSIKNNVSRISMATQDKIISSKLTAHGSALYSIIRDEELDVVTQHILQIDEDRRMDSQ